MSSGPKWIYDFNEQTYFFIDNHNQRVYQNDPRLANQRADNPRTLPQQRDINDASANIPYNRTLRPGAYTVTPQQLPTRHSRVPSSAGAEQEMYRERQQPYTSAEGGSAFIAGFQSLDLRSGAANTLHDNQPQRQQAGSSRLLRTEFQKREKPARFFTQGKVFIVLWSEGSQADRESVMSGAAWSRNSYNEWVYTKVRRFIVVNPGVKSCVAVPITTNSGQGAAKEGERKSDYCIVHSGAIVPPLGPREGPAFAGDASMQSQAIRIDMDEKVKLDPMSRINLAEPQTIQHYYKVKSIGKVNPKSMAALRYQFKLVMGGGTSTIASSSGQSASAQSTQYSEADKYKALLGKGYSPQQARDILRTLQNPRHARKQDDHRPGVQQVVRRITDDDDGEIDSDDDSNDEHSGPESNGND